MTEPDEQAASQCPLQAKSYLVQDETDENGERVYHARIPEGLYLELIAAWKACAAPANEAYRLVFEALQLTPGSSKQDVARIRNALTLLPALKPLPEQNLNPSNSTPLDHIGDIAEKAARAGEAEVMYKAAVTDGRVSASYVTGLASGKYRVNVTSGEAVTAEITHRVGRALEIITPFPEAALPHEKRQYTVYFMREVRDLLIALSALSPQRDDSGLVGELARVLSRAYEVMRSYTTSCNDEDEWNNDDVIECRELIRAALARAFRAKAGA